MLLGACRSIKLSERRYTKQNLELLVGNLYITDFLKFIQLIFAVFYMQEYHLHPKVLSMPGCKEGAIKKISF